MSCPNINSPEWKSLVDTIGENNAWKEFIVHGEIPDVSLYDVEKKGNKVLYSIRTKSTEQIKKGINPANIKTEQEIKHTKFILSGVLNTIGDISPNKKIAISPDKAFDKVKGIYTELKDSINLTLQSFIKSDQDLKDIKSSPAYEDLKKEFPVIGWVDSYDDLLKASGLYSEIVQNFKKYKSFVTIELAHKGVKIKKGKFEIIQPEDVENKEQDDTEDVSIANEEVSKERFDRSAFETNPRETATVRVKGLVQTIQTGEFEFGIPLYADGDTVLDDILYAGTAMNLSGFTDKASKLEVFRAQLGMLAEGRPYLKFLLEKLNKFETAGDWEIINQVLTFASKAYAEESLLLYNLSKSGKKVRAVSKIKVVGSNRDKITDQVNRTWLSRHKTSGFFNKSANGDLTPNMEKVDELNKIRLEGKALTGEAQVKKFIEYFNVLGINFTNKDLDYIAPRLVTELRKGKGFERIFADGLLLDLIYKSFKKNENVVFQDQYGFQDEKGDMKVLAKLYNEANPGLIKEPSTKTADNKSKHLNIQPSHVEITKREWNNSDGTNVTNTALAQPNSKEEVGFWSKVKQKIYKFVLGYFSGSREQEQNKDGKVRKNFTEKDQYVSIIMKHQENMNEGTYITFTLSDKTTTMETKMTKEFFVDSKNAPVGLGKDYTIENGGIVYSDSLKDKIYNSFVEPEVSRILASMKFANSVNLENFNTASKLFYFFPNLNSHPSLQAFRDDLYSGTKTIEDLNRKHAKTVADVILNEFDISTNDQIKKFVTNGILEFKNGKYTHPLFLRSYVRRFEETKASNPIITKLMMMDLKLNYMNAQIKTIQFLKFDPMHCFKAFKGFKTTDFNSISGEDKVKLANSTWDEFSKRAAALIAPGAQGNWSWKYDNNTKNYSSTTYRSVTLKDVKKDVANYEGVETTDAQEYVTMQEHIDYLMSEGKIPMSVWESIHNKIEAAKNRPDRYYELDDKELKYVFSPTKPVYAGNSNEGDDTGLNRFDYIKSSRYPLIPQQEAGSERDKLRIWMEKNNIQSAIFGSGKKAGRPSLSIEVFDKDNNFIEPKDFSKGIQELSRDGLRNQQEIPHQKDEIATVSQMNRTLFDGLLESEFEFADMKKQKGAQLKSIKEQIRSRLFEIAADKLRDKLGNVWKSHEGLYELLKQTIENDTTGSYTENDLKSLELGKDGMFKKSLELQFKFPKFQGLINSMINKNVMLKMNGTSFVQVSGAGAKFNFSDLSQGVKSGIIWTDSYAKNFKNGEVSLKYIDRKENGKVTPAQVIVSQYIRDEDGNLIDLNDFITEKKGIKILDTSRLSPSLLQLVASRIPNQSHVSTLPIEVVGFLPSYMENTIIVPDGITGQMGSDFDVDKLYAYVSKTVKGENKKGQVTYGPIEYSISDQSDINKLSEDQLNQALRDIHWTVLTHPDTYDNITKSVDNPEVKEKVKTREEQLAEHKISTDKGANLPLDFGRSIDRFIDNKSGKDGVSIFANLISAQADMQDKILTLGFYNKETKKNETVPIKIKLSKNGKEIIDLAYIGKTGKSKSFLNKVRTISDNLNISFTESVDNAKNQFLRYFNWDNKSMGAVGFLEMLSDENGQAVPIEFVMDLTSQPIIKNLLDLMDLKQDSFGEFDLKAIDSSVVDLTDKIYKTVDEQNLLGGSQSAKTYFENPKRNKVLDPQTLADMWLVGQANTQPKEQREASLKSIMKSLNDKYFSEKGGPTYNSINDLLLEYYGVQHDSLYLFYDLQSKGRELMTILGSIYTYTKGVGSNIFVTMQKLNQLNKLGSSENFLGIENLAGIIKKNDDTGLISIAPQGEIGSSIKNSLIFAQDELYLKLFPIATGQQLKDIVNILLENQGLEPKDVGRSKYETTHENAFRAVINYLYTVPELELFDNVVETRDRLINGDNSLGKRILKLTENPQWAKNGFLKNLDIEPIWKSKAYSISFKAPFGTDIDEKAVTSGFYEMVISDDEEIRQIAKDLAIYPFATGDAGNIGRFIPVDYTMNDKDFSKAIGRIRGTYVSNMKVGGIPTLIDQIVQNNPEEHSKKFDFSSIEGEGDSPFKSALRPLIGNASDLTNVANLKFTLGNFKQQFIKDSLKVPLTEREINLLKAQDSTVDVYESDGKTLKTKYPPYILITDSYEGVFNSFSDRSVKYLYKRVSPLLEPVAEYQRINILGIGNIKEYSFDNPELKSVIDNNAVDTTRIQMQSDEPDMSFGLTPDMFEDYSIKPKVTNIKPSIDTSREWKGDLESRPVYTAEGVNTMRTSAAKLNEHFGNPFSEAGYPGTIKVSSIADAVVAYKDWLLGNKYENVKPEQRAWILDQINQGKLDGATLLYAGKSERRGQGMHPTALAEVVDELRSKKQVGKFSKKNLFSIIPQQGVVDRKAAIKASIATQYIGFGEGLRDSKGRRSSTEIYREQAKEFANTGNYSANDVIFVSVPGKRGAQSKRKEQQDKTIKEAIKAVEAGATILTDNKAYIESSDYNEGEKRLYKNMEAKGYNYSETTVDDQVIGVWSKSEKPSTKENIQERQTDFGDYRLLYNEQDGDYDLMGPDGLEGERLSYEEAVEYINMKLAGLDQPVSDIVVYKDKNFIIEGDLLSGYDVYYQKKDGSKGALVDQNVPLYNKVMLSRAVIQDPGRVVTLTDMQHSPSYYVTYDNRILSLNPTSFGEEKDSVDIRNRVMTKLNEQEETVDEDNVTEEEVKNFLEDTKSFMEDMNMNGKNIVVPKGSNPNNMPILETNDTIYLMNDGQQEAYDFIGNTVKEILNTRKRVTASDLNNATMAFTDPLSKKFNGVIPQAMWDNMIGLAGRGGVGKTTVIKAIIDSIKKENKYSQPSVMYLAPGHTAATVLQESMGLDSEKANDGTVNTIASHLRKRPNDSGTFSLISEPDYIKSTAFKPAFGRPDIIVIDEGSMIGVDDIKDMVTRLKSDLNEGLISKLPVFIFMGDYRQLGPIGEGQNKLVNKGAISSTLFLDKSKTKELTQVMRSDNEYLHQIYDSVGEQIVNNMNKTKNGEEPVTPLFKKYDALTKKSTESILVVNNKDGVIDDYATYLSTNNNPYGMFWVHYNKVDNPITKNLNAKIRKAYFEKAGLPIVEEKHRLFAKGDYVEFTGGLEIDTDNFEYIPENNQIQKILEDLKYPKKGERYTIIPGVIKPNARIKVLDIVTRKEDLSTYIHPSIRRALNNPNIKVDVETSIIFNRQNKVRAVSKVLDIAVGPMTGKNQFGTYDKVTKRMKGIKITNVKTGEVLGEFDLPYSTYLDVVENLIMLNSSGSTMPFVPSYIGSSHTAQGNTIKNVIVGDDNIKAAAANGKTNIDDIFSSMYVGLTRTSGTLTIIKPMGFDLINNQSIYMGAITDTNNKLRPKSAIQPITSVEEAEYYEEERNDQEFDLDSFMLANIKQDVTDFIFNEPDTKKILNKIYKTATPLNKQLLDLVSKTGGVNGLKIIVDNKAINPGSYDPATKVMIINPSLAIEDNVDDIDVATQQIHDVVMHELIHYVTADLLNADIRTLTPDQRKWVISLNNLFKTVQDRMLNDPNHSEALQRAIEQVNSEGGYLSASDKSQYYGLTNVHDFVSMLMSDAGFREFMNNVKFDGNKSILDRFLDILTNILKALGINVKDDSVLKEGVTNIVGLVESRNQKAQNNQNDIQRSIATKSSKVEMVTDNFEELLKILNIKSYC